MGWGMNKKDAVKLATPYTQRTTNINAGGLVSALLTGGALLAGAYLLKDALKPVIMQPPVAGQPGEDTDTQWKIDKGRWR